MVFSAAVFVVAEAGISGAANSPPPPARMALPPSGEEVPLARIKDICAFYGLRDLWRKIERDPPARPFKSDGCTGWFDDWKGVSLYPAGFLHDLNIGPVTQGRKSSVSLPMRSS